MRLQKAEGEIERLVAEETSDLVSEKEADRIVNVDLTGRGIDSVVSLSGPQSREIKKTLYLFSLKSQSCHTVFIDQGLRSNICNYFNVNVSSSRLNRCDSFSWAEYFPEGVVPKRR